MLPQLLLGKPYNPLGGLSTQQETIFIQAHSSWCTSAQSQICQIILTILVSAGWKDRNFSAFAVVGWNAPSVLERYTSLSHQIPSDHLLWVASGLSFPKFMLMLGLGRWSWVNGFCIIAEPSGVNTWMGLHQAPKGWMVTKKAYLSFVLPGTLASLPVSTKRWNNTGVLP